MLNPLENATLRRMLVLVLGVVLVALEKKLGLQLDDATKAEITGMVVAYIMASNAKDAAIEKAKAAGVAAAATVTTTQAAVDTMNAVDGNASLKGPNP